jgi:(2Fe-2S) ferredoxin
VIYPEGIWYRLETTQDVDAVLERHVVAGERVTHLLLPVE